MALKIRTLSLKKNLDVLIKKACYSPLFYIVLYHALSNFKFRRFCTLIKILTEVNLLLAMIAPALLVDWLVGWLVCWLITLLVYQSLYHRFRLLVAY